MPLISCPDCQHNCSTSAKSCPNCGYVFKVPRSNVFGGLLGSCSHFCTSLLRSKLFLIRCKIACKIFVCSCILYFIVAITVIIWVVHREVMLENPSQLSDTVPFIWLTPIGVLISYVIGRNIYNLFRDFIEVGNNSEKIK